jgi:ribokinase
LRNNKIWVLGSSNIDCTYRMEQLPVKGTTVSADEILITTGGKGANQAIAAAHWGAHVHFIGAVGDDDNGKRLLDCLISHGVDTENVSVIKGAASGQAIILVDHDGDNFIVIHGGANLKVPCTVPSAIEISNGDVFVSQLETNLEALGAYAAFARKQRALTILNPSPYQELPVSILANIDLIVANEIEAAQLGRTPVEDVHTAQSCGSAIRRKNGIKAVIITLGAEGAVLVEEERSFHFPGYTVNAVDTQGAGDAFLGSLIAKLAQKAPIERAVSFSNWVAAQSVTRRGSTQHSLPEQSSAVNADLSRFVGL